jgi:glycosyltransferase involved in cell wall biosynthesis
MHTERYQHFSGALSREMIYKCASDDDHCGVLMQSLVATLRIAVVTNIPTPYRTAFFNAVARECRARNITFKVFFAALTEPNRFWVFDSSEVEYDYSFVPGLHINRGGGVHHISPSIVPQLVQYRPDVVLCAGAWHMSASVLAAVLARLRGFRTMFWSEGHAAAIRHSAGGVRWGRRKVLSLYDGFAVPNSRSLEWLIAETATRRPVITLPNSVDGKFYTRRHASERADARIRLGLDNEGLLFVQTSQLNSRKGVMALASRFIQLPNALRRSARLAFLGNGPDEPELRDLAQRCDGKILVAGAVPSTGVRSWLMAADWFVLNTTFDPNPLSPIEASFAKLPLLLTRRAGNFQELLVEAETGFAIEDPEKPEAALTKALLQPLDRTRDMGENAFRNVAQVFDASSVALKLVEDISHFARSGHD